VFAVAKPAGNRHYPRTTTITVRESAGSGFQPSRSTGQRSTPRRGQPCSSRRSNAFRQQPPSTSFATASSLAIRPGRITTHGLPEALRAMGREAQISPPPKTWARIGRRYPPTTVVYRTQPNTLRSSLSRKSPGQGPFPEFRRWCPRQDSNLRSRLRRAVLYPLSYGGVRITSTPSQSVPRPNGQAQRGWPRSAGRR
jgi:hypothetical protein